MPLRNSGNSPVNEQREGLPIPSRGRELRIGDRKIGDGRVYVIGEIGGNHDGHLAQALHLVEAAAAAGADCAKFQLFKPDALYPGTHTEGSISPGWLATLRRQCDLLDVDFMCSVFCQETLRMYQQTSPVAVKIASPEAANDELLEAASSLPMLVSTGALDWDGTDRVNGLLRALDAEYALLHCVSSYPAPVRQMNLSVISRMRERYGVPVGLSDHTLHAWRAPLAAYGQGASIVEKHLTLDRALKGPDHSYALTPAAFASMVRELRIAERLHGDGVKRVQSSEDATDRRVAA